MSDVVHLIGFPALYEGPMNPALPVCISVCNAVLSRMDHYFFLIFLPEVGVQ